MTCDDDQQAATPPTQHYYPEFADLDDDARRRWDLCVAVAAGLMDEAPDGRHAQFMARHLFHGDTPT